MDYVKCVERLFFGKENYKFGSMSSKTPARDDIQNYLLLLLFFKC